MTGESLSLYDRLKAQEVSQEDIQYLTKNNLINEDIVNGEETLLMRACVDKDKTLVRKLLSLGADANVKCSKYKGETPIFKTCTLSSPNNLVIARMLIDNGAQLDVKTRIDKYTPLHQACFCGRSAVAILLVENGANVNAMNAFQETPLHISLKYEHVTMEVVNLLLQKGADLYSPEDARGMKPIDYVESGGWRHNKQLFIDTYERHHSPSKNFQTSPYKNTPIKRKSTTLQTPEKQHGSSSGSSEWVESAPLRSFTGAIVYKPLGQSTPVKQHSAPLTPSRSTRSNSRISSNSDNRYASPPANRTPSRYTSPLKNDTSVVSSLFSSFTDLPSTQINDSNDLESSSMAPKNPQTPTRSKSRPLPAPKNTPTITSFFPSAGRKVIPTAPPTKSEKFEILKCEGKSSAVKRKKDSTRTRTSKRYKNGEVFDRCRRAIVSNTDSSGASSDSGLSECGYYSDIDYDNPPPGVERFIPYVGKRFLDTDDHLVFKVHSICTNPDYEEVMFKYYSLSSGNSSPPESDDDYEYSACIEMLQEGSWAQWLNTDE